MHKDVQSFLYRHPEIVEQFREKFEIIAQNPNAPFLDIKPMQGMKNNRRLRIWKRRFLYEIKEQEIIIWIWKASNRSEAYKNI